MGAYCFHQCVTFIRGSVYSMFLALVCTVRVVAKFFFVAHRLHSVPSNSKFLRTIGAQILLYLI